MQPCSVACNIADMIAAIAANLLFNHNFARGEVFSDVFSRTIAIHANGFDENVRRVSGSASYRVLRTAGRVVTFRSAWRYDGKNTGSIEMTQNFGTNTVTFGGKTQTPTDASGLIPNPLLWGTPPRVVAPGTFWFTQIPTAWELGPAAKQMQRTISIDSAADTGMFERSGSGDDNASKMPKVTLHRQRGGNQQFTVIASHSSWQGYTIVRAGIIVSDELVRTSKLALRSSEGDNVAATRREYILLNLAPGLTDRV